MISVDCETGGTDHKHGARAFLVTTCNEQQEVKYWEWMMDPVTRRPEIEQNDLAEIEETLLSADYIVGQNIGFDVAALREIGVLKDRWPWDRTYDTTLAAHLLQSNYPKDLTTLARRYLGVRIDKYEEATRECVLAARRMVSSDSDTFPGWRIAKKGLSEMPSAKETVWKYDLWLPRAVANRLDYRPSHPWWTVTSDYANTDSSVTLPLFQVMEKLIKDKGLWPIYLERLKLLPIVYSMQERGITIHKGWLSEKEAEFEQLSEEAGQRCRAIAETYDHELELPKNGNNKSLLSFCFDSDKLNLPHAPVKKKKKTTNPSLDKDAITFYEGSLPERSKALAFLKSLKTKRKRDTAISYMEGYRRHWLPVKNPYYRLHPSLNPVGTATLRWSSANPNSQNISKQEEASLRGVFGPAPGREWWSLDAKNLELRIPAYEAGETEMINIFEKPDDPPYYGSYHLLVFDTLHPEKFAKDGAKCKELYDSTWYQWTKNGNFAVGYGSVESSGTADRAYHVPGAFRMIKGRFTKIHGPGGLNDQCIAHAEKYGFVETVRDKTIDCLRGYPIHCDREERGGVKPTVPLNYHVQSTAMWWMSCSMVRCYEYIEGLRGNGFTGFLMAQVHDELLFDFPQGKGDKPWLTNLPKIRRIKYLMELGGENIGVPTPVSVKYHAESWAKGQSIAV